ncbi:hypothetical protein JHK87_047605 [Glycine soja]|nr:hypothetical protein JHK87_047605 [Glycine soja]
MAELKAAGATWIQFDEPNLVKDLNAHQLQAFTHAYTALEFETCYKDEVEDLEKASITVIQIDKATLREEIYSKPYKKNRERIKEYKRTKCIAKATQREGNRG